MDPLESLNGLETQSRKKLTFYHPGLVEVPGETKIIRRKFVKETPYPRSTKESTSGCNSVVNDYFTLTGKFLRLAK